MPWVIAPHWQADGITQRMNDSGWLEDHQASVALDVPARRVETLGATGTIRTQQIHGRTFYCLDDITAMRAGFSPSEVRDQKHYDEHGAAMGWPMSSTAQRVPEPPTADPGMDFLREFGG
jgi:hypothetical protein